MRSKEEGEMERGTAVQLCSRFPFRPFCPSSNFFGRTHPSSGKRAAFLALFLVLTLAAAKAPPESGVAADRQFVMGKLSESRPQSPSIIIVVADLNGDDEEGTSRDVARVVRQCNVCVPRSLSTISMEAMSSSAVVSVAWRSIWWRRKLRQSPANLTNGRGNARKIIWSHRIGNTRGAVRSIAVAQMKSSRRNGSLSARPHS